jgi:AcrR family transcriptional regulator
MPAPESRPRRASAALKRDDLLPGAARAFLENGFQATTMEKVADACRVGKGTLYEYFPSKEDLFIEVCLSGFETDSEAIEAAFRASADPAATLERVFDAILDGVPAILERMPLYFTLWDRLSFDERYRDKCRQGVRDVYRDFREALARGIARAQERGTIRRDLDPRDMATVIQCAVDGFTYLQVFAGRDVDVERLATALRAVLFSGIGLRGAGASDGAG